MPSLAGARARDPASKSLSMRPAPRITSTSSPLLPSKACAVDLALEIHGDAVAFATLALHRRERRALFAQVLQHRLDVGVRHLRHRARDGEAVHSTFSTISG